LALKQVDVSFAVTATALILGLTAAAIPLYFASAGSAAVSIQVTQRCDSTLGNSASGAGPISGLVRAQKWLEATSEKSVRAARAPEYALSAPSITLAADASIEDTKATQTSTPTQLVTVTNGLTHISIVSHVTGAGVWISNDLASSLHLRAGAYTGMSISTDPTQVTTPSKSVRIRIVGIYRSLNGTTLPTFWCSQSALFGEPDADSAPPSVILTDQATFLSILRADQEATISDFAWEQSPSPKLDLPDAKSTLSALNGFSQAIAAGRGSESPFRPIPGGFVVGDVIPPQYDFVIAHAEAVDQAVHQGITPEAVACAIIAALLVGAAGIYWADRRRIEISLFASRGVSPWALGIKASLEMIFPIAAGTFLGWISAIGLISEIGPSSSLGSAAISDSGWFALGAGIAGLALLGVVGTFRSQRITEARSKSNWVRHGKIPAVLLGLGLTLWTGLSLGHLSLDAGATTAQPVKFQFVVFPILFLTCFIALTVRLLVSGPSFGLLREATHGYGVALWLAARRISGNPVATGALIATLAAAVGMFVYASALTRSEEMTVRAKAETFVGADVSATINSLGNLPPSLSSKATEVLVDRNESVASAEVDVIGVDPTNFAKGAFWDGSYANRPLSALMNDLESARLSHGSIPVIVTGGSHLSLGQGVVLSGDSASSPVHHIRKIAIAGDFPGQNGTTPLLVMTRTELNRIDPNATSQVWALGPETQVLNDLARAHISTTIVVTSAEVLDQTSFASIGWTFAYLQSLGILIGAVAVAGLFLFLSQRSRASALAYLLTRRMGLTVRSHVYSLGIEMGGLFLIGGVLGWILAWIAVEIVSSHIDPIPGLPPRFLVEVPWVGLAISTAVAGCACLTATAWAQRCANRRIPSELLRFYD
jgi:hypothetical protein